MDAKKAAGIAVLAFVLLCAFGGSILSLAGLWLAWIVPLLLLGCVGYGLYLNARRR